MSPESNHWFVDHANVVTLVNWNYEADFRVAQAIADEKAAA